jgi:hypothetical protein
MSLTLTTFFLFITPTSCQVYIKTIQKTDSFLMLEEPKKNNYMENKKSSKVLNNHKAEIH